MSAPEEQQPETEATDELGESDGISERTAKIILVVVASGAMWGIVAAAPYVAYVVIGVLGCLGWQKARAWIGKRRDAEQAEEETASPDVGEALRRLIGDDKGVLLTVLRDDLDLPDTKAVKVLLDDAGIPWKASRTRAGNGPAVRAESIPPAPSPVVADSHGDGCCCRSSDNNNANNGPTTLGGEGLRVEPIGDAGTLVRKPADDADHRPGCGH